MNFPKNYTTVRKGVLMNINNDFTIKTWKSFRIIYSLLYFRKLFESEMLLSLQKHMVSNIILYIDKAILNFKSPYTESGMLQYTVKSLIL